MKHKQLLFLLFCAHISFCTPIDLTVCIQEGAGFFAELHKVVQCLIHYENQLTNIHVDWNDEFFPYKDNADENGWDLFFEPIALEHKETQTNEQRIIYNSSAEFHELHDQCCTAPWIDYYRFLPYRRYVHNILTKYIHLKPAVQNEWDTFYITHMKDHICIGVHARIARQHAWLVPGKHLPSLDDYYKEVDHLLSKHDDKQIKIFVASDSHQAIQAFKHRYGDKIVHINAFRSEETNDPCIMYISGAYFKKHKDAWHERKHRYFGGLTTLLDCLLLSKCDYMIHTTSNLAFFATYYNPEIKSIYLPKGIPSKECRFKDDVTINNRFLNPQGIE